MTNLHILVTGGAGYIGSILVPYLLSNGYRVTVLDNFRYHQMSLLDCFFYSGLKVVRGDASDEVLLKKLMRDADYIFPLACLVGAPLCDKNPMEARAVNLDAIHLILQLRSRDQRIIFPNTNSGYGIGQKDIFCTEETPLRPISLYGKLKVEAEQAVLDSGNSITYRLATVFGMSPRMRIDLLVNSFVFHAVHIKEPLELFEAHFKRNYIHVRDVARAFRYAIGAFDSMKDRPYNVGLPDANLSKWKLCIEIKKEVPQFNFVENTKGEDPDKRNYIVSSERIRIAGFTPQISLREGIRELVKGYQIITDSSGLSNI